ncbi:MAG: FHA domain-containing protein [Chloroflexota bacterium]
MENLLFLVMRQGPEPKRRFPLNKDVVLIGRADDNDIVIQDKEVSRHHAFIIQQDNQWIIEDVGSKNGIYVNGESIVKQQQLMPGCLIALGPNVLFSMETPRTPSPDRTPTVVKREASHPPIQIEDETSTAIHEKR